jgi:chromosome partitioning protein
MKTIAFFGQKGGGTKSTTAIHASCRAQDDGERVILLDADPQKSASSWARQRVSETPVVTAVHASELQLAIHTAHNKGFSLAVIDSPPHLAHESSQIAQAADMIIIPVRPSAALEIARVQASAKMARAAGKAPYFLLTRVHARRRDQAHKTAADLAGLGAVIPCWIGDRLPFEDAISLGLSVNEYKPRDKAALEMTALWAWVKEELCRK